METPPSSSQEGHSTLRERLQSGEVRFLGNTPRPQLREEDGTPSWYPPDPQLEEHLETMKHYHELHGKDNVTVGPALVPTTDPEASARSTLGVYVTTDAYEKMHKKQ